MNRRGNLLFAAVLTAATLLAGTAPSRAEVLERILAIVNDEVITEQDLQIVMAPVVAQLRTAYSDREFEDQVTRIRGEFLNKLIEDKLVLSEARRLKVIVQDPEVEQMLADVRNKFPTREIFLRAIEEQGLTEKKLFTRFQEQLMAQKLVNFEVKSRVSVSPGEINEYYRSHEGDFSRGDRVRLEQILVRVGSRTEEEAAQFAASLRQQIAGGKSFSELASAYSEGSEAKDGGQMGWIERGQLMGEIDEKVFALSAGEVTEPIRSTLGYHLFRVVERETTSLRPLEEVRDEIQDILFKQKLRKRLESWIADLKKNAYISIR